MTIKKNIRCMPPVIRSREHLMVQGVSFLPTGALAPTTLPLALDGTTLTLAQESAWLDQKHFAVGRWDGSLSIFAFNDSPNAGPLISKAVNTPAFEGVQMITWLAPGVFSSSNDDGSMIIWGSQSLKWTDLRPIDTLQYDPILGVANSGDTVTIGNQLYLAVGHANGYVSLWDGNLDGSVMRFMRAVDVRNARPTNPWELHNIRGISTLVPNDSTAYIVTGSEDGYISVLRLPDGDIMSQVVYNPSAQRGINSIATFGQNLLVANCAVGPDDKNLWYYRIDPKKLTVEWQDSTNLRVSPSAPQVFNFCTAWGIFNNQVGFFASTEEGALWVGTVTPDRRLSVIGYETVFGTLGSTLAFNSNGKLIVVNYNLYEYAAAGNRIYPATLHPERLALDALPTVLRG